MSGETRYDEATVELVASKLPFVNFDDDDFDEVDLIRHVLDALADAGLLMPPDAEENRQYGRLLLDGEVIPVTRLDPTHYRLTGPWLEVSE